MLLYNGLFWLLILGHVVGDFYLQPRKMSEEKRTNPKAMFWHAAIYALVIALSMWPIAFGRGQWTAYLYVWLAVAFSHAFIDWAKASIGARWLGGRPVNKTAVYVADQLLHIGVIFAVTLAFRMNVGRTLLNRLGDQVDSTLMYYVTSDAYRSLHLLQYLCIFLIIGKPANMLVNLLVPAEEGADIKKEQMIGVLERFLTVLLLFTQQYAVIALYFVGKSIAWRVLGGQEKGVERYLLVTLLSLAIAVAVVILAGPAAPMTVMSEISPNG